MSSTNKTLGVWMSGKKSQKLNWKELTSTCFKHGYKLLKVDLERHFEDQDRIDVFLHKLTDVITAADQGGHKASQIISRVEQYLSNHPDIIVIDPLDSVRILLNRYRYYTILDEDKSLRSNGIITPTFAEFTTNDYSKNIELIRNRNVNFPIVCKPTQAHGSKEAHEMIVIFNENDLKVCKPPCVVQSFVNHNAVLHKVFVVGNRYSICQRPSLKNFYNSEDLEPIFYSTSEVCKADSQSTLSILDPSDHINVEMKMNEVKVSHIIKVLRKKLRMLLFGFDVVIDNVTGEHAVIDINVFPSYDHFPNFFEHLLDCINDLARSPCDSNINNGLNELDCHRQNGFVNVNSLSHNGVDGMYLNT